MTRFPIRDACILGILSASCDLTPGERLLVPAPGSPIAMPGGTGHVELADVNRDGHLDLAVSAGRERGLEILLGNGTGAFASLQGTAAMRAVRTGETSLGDFDGDGHVDLAVASHDSYEVVVLLGDGLGAFSPAPTSPAITGNAGQPHNHGLVTGDVNGDGPLDLVAVNSGDGTIAVLLGDGRGGFAHASGSPFAAGPGPYPAALGDVDGDGRLDIAVPDSGTGRYSREHGSLARTVTVLLGDGKGGFRPAPYSPLTVLEGPYFATLGDLDGDQRLDLVVAHDDSSSITILLNDGGTGFRPAPQSPFDLGRRAWKIVVADADGDRRADLLLATGDSVTVLLGDGRGRFAPAPGSPFAAGRGAWTLAVGDLDDDGRLDTVTSNVESEALHVLLGQR
jgi:VCBS repeat protein